MMTDIATFPDTEALPITDWFAVDDSVMGGISQSRWENGDSAPPRFTGYVSLERNGGFASVRSPQLPISFAGFSGLRIRVRGDGQTYSLCLHSAGLLPGTSYRCRFETIAGEWQTVELPFEDFVLMRFGQRVGVSPVKPERITALSFMISDKQEGAFTLEVESLTLMR
jgi:NADH dehydrogenase [ubiquinone] 1 alpha subcomplex assembly factor 1